MNLGIFLKYVVPSLFAMVGSVAVVRLQQAPREEQGAVGYKTLADSVNKLQYNQERLEDELRMVTRLCVPRQGPDLHAVSPRSITLQGLTPLQRVPSRLEHLPTKE